MQVGNNQHISAIVRKLVRTDECRYNCILVDYVGLHRVDVFVFDAAYEQAERADVVVGSMGAHLNPSFLVNSVLGMSLIGIKRVGAINHLTVELQHIAHPLPNSRAEDAR